MTLILLKKKVILLIIIGQANDSLENKYNSAFRLNSTLLNTVLRYLAGLTTSNKQKDPLSLI